MPNVCIAFIQASIACLATLRLTDTFHYQFLEHRGSQPGPSSPRAKTPTSSEPLSGPQIDETTALLQHASRDSNLSVAQGTPRQRQVLPFVKVWTPDVIRTMLAQFIIAGHLGTFAILWAMLLSLPAIPSQTRHSPFKFSGGLGLQPHSVGIVMSAFGLAGIILQVLVYPSLQERWGTIRTWRAALCLFPVVYAIAPFCALIPRLGTDIDRVAPGLFIVVEWSALLAVLLTFAAGRTGVVPATSLLINDCTPHPAARGTIHTLGVICSNLSRTVFPPLTLAVMGFGLRVGVVGLGFWFVAVLALLSIVASLTVREGTNGE